MPYVSKEQLTAAREVDLLTYLRCFEPQELVHISGSTYVTRTHAVSYTHLTLPTKLEV